MMVWIWSLASVVIVSLVSLIGVATVSLSTARLKRILLYLVSFSVGALFGDAFIHLVPEAYEELGGGLRAPFLVIGGILLFFVLEKFVHWRHCHVPTSEDHPHPVVFMNLVGDGLHNFIDGVIIGASYLVSVPIGVATTLAVVFHEIPQEIGDFGILLHGGLTRARALALNFLSATLAVAGCLLSLVIGPEFKGFMYFTIPVTAGGFIYIAASDLVPELHKEVDPAKSLTQLIVIVAGVAVMALLAFFE